MSTFEQARVLVTGGARGIGFAIARAFADQGASVTIADIDGEAARTSAASLGGARGVALDVVDADAVLRHFADEEHGYDIVVANAGVGGPAASVADIEPEAWKRTMSVNLDGVFHTMKGAASRMREDGIAGSILVTASIAGLTAEANHAAYCASKWAVIGLLKSAAIELAPHGIRVNGVCPGDVDTALLGDMLDDDVYRGPFDRLGDPAEVAEAYLWLASKSARFVSGETLVVDGGLVNTALVH